VSSTEGYGDRPERPARGLPLDARAIRTNTPGTGVSQHPGSEAPAVLVYSPRRMSRLIAALQGAFLVCGLLALAIPADVACCAGAMKIHGADCCASATTDRRASSCCEGDGSATTLRSENPAPRFAIALSLLPDSLHASAPLSPPEEAASNLPPPARRPFRLHAPLLL
jgi:hypothetical protein